MQTINKQKQQNLRAKAHSLKPIVSIGMQGLTDNVLAEIERALSDHELIKVKTYGHDRDTRKEYAEVIAKRSQAHLVQAIGHIFVFYRKSDKETEKKPIKRGNDANSRQRTTRAKPSTHKKN